MGSRCPLRLSALDDELQYVLVGENHEQRQQQGEPNQMNHDLLALIERPAPDRFQPNDHETAAIQRRDGQQIQESD